MTARGYLRHVAMVPYVDGRRWTLRTWDTGHPHGRGPQWCVGYELRGPDGSVIFTGEDYGCSPMHAIDSDECLRGILGFLTLRPGDTDADYFDEYTDEQHAFAETDAESLSLWTMDEDAPEFEEVEP